MPTAPLFGGSTALEGLGQATAVCTANTTVTGANTNTDITGCSITLPPGQWSIEASVTVTDSAANNSEAYIVQGASTILSGGAGFQTAAGQFQCVSVPQVTVTPLVTTTYKLQVRTSTATGSARAQTANSGVNGASAIWALQTG